MEFDNISLKDGKTKAVNIRIVTDIKEFPELESEKKIQIVNLLTTELKHNSFINCADLPVALKIIGVDYKRYADNLGSFIQNNFSGIFSVKKQLEINGKKYPAVIVESRKSIDKISEEERRQIEIRLDDESDKNGFFQASKFQFILREVGIIQCMDYAACIDDLIYLLFQNKYVPKKNVKINDKIYPHIYVQAERADEFIEGVIFENTVPKTGEKKFFLNERNDSAVKEEVVGIIKEKEMSNENLMLKMKSLYGEHEYESIFKLKELGDATPHILGIAGLELLLKALLSYLGEDVEKATLNEFHKILIRTEKVQDLKKYKDDVQLLKLGMETAFISVGLDDFRKIFGDVHNGKKNLNYNWKGIIERFWGAKSELAIYFTCLWLIICEKEEIIDLYIEEAGKENKIDKLPIILKIYQEFAMNGEKIVSARLKRKILGHCFDCNDTHTLIVSSAYFDMRSIPEIKEVIEFLKEERTVDSEDLIRWFCSELGALVSEKIINFYWWRNSVQGFDMNLFRILAFVCWEYPEGYFTEIIYNTSCPLFGKKEKEQILFNHFAQLCQHTKVYKKAYVLVNYVYLKLVENLNDIELNEIWNELKNWMKLQVLQELSADIRSACRIEVFRYDSILRQEAEEYYCSNFIAEKVNGSSEDELDEFVDECERNGLQFITQWIVDNGGKSIKQDGERYIKSLISSQQFQEAIQFLKKETSFDNTKKIILLREILCENFKYHHLVEIAYTMFSHIIPVDVAESALLYGFTFTQSDTIVALISIYMFKKEWIKAAFLYAPFRKQHINAHRKFIDDVRLAFFSNGIDPNRSMDSHYDIMKVALKVCTSKEFDEFISWAKNIPIPNASKAYVPKVKTFDSVLKNMLSVQDYDDCWTRLAILALRTDNNDKQDTLRYCIIAGFIGRYGIKQFNQVICGLEKNKYSKKSYSDYYISLWKGLFNGRYSLNFLTLSQDIIWEVPATFWNIFYDIAVRKNHVFSADDFEYSAWKTTMREDQSFYNEVLDKYSDTRETVFLKIAVSILLESQQNIIPSFEKYLPYCNSGRNKDFLYSALIQLVQRGKYLLEIGELLGSNYWRCTEIEQRLAQVLLAFCTEKFDYIFEEDEQDFSIIQIESFRADYLKCVQNYPEICIVNTLKESIHGRGYKYKLMQFLVQIKNHDKQFHDPEYTALKEEVDSAPLILDDWNEDIEIKYYLEFIIAFYKKQSEQGSDDLIFIRNRYCRILAASMLLEPVFAQYSDDDIISLMKRNKHFAVVYSGYENLKKSLYEFVGLNSISQRFKVVFIMGLISNKWEQFIELGKEYDKKSLEIIKKIENYTNYRDLNIQIIKRFIFERQGQYEDEELEFVECCMPSVAFVLKKMKFIRKNDIEYYPICEKLIRGICRISDPDRASRTFTNLSYYLKEYPEDLRKYWDVYMNALMSTSYNKTIIVNLAAKIRQKKLVWKK